MKKFFIKGTNWVLAGIMGLCGFASCDRITFKAAYMAPAAKFTVKGMVLNEATGEPIERIRVGFSPAEWNEDAYGPQPENYRDRNIFETTNSNGAFTLTTIGSYGYIVSFYVEDIDGEENGLYQPRKIDVDFKDVKQSGNGDYTVTTTIQLAEVEIE